MQTDQTNEPGWQFSPDGSAVAPEAQPKQAQPTAQPPAPAAAADVSWSASEFIAYHKPSGWYAAVIGITVLVAGLTFLLTKDFFAVGTVVVMAILFMIYANRKPRVLDYSLSRTGVRIGTRAYPYGLFRSFAVIDQGSMQSIMLVPLQRLKPPIDMYFDPKDGDKILDTLSKYLPHEQREMDVVDKFLHRIKF